LGPQDELFVRGPNLMQGYWHQPDATALAIDADGWLHTGDLAELQDGYVAIRGRLKDILVTSTGHKVPPADMEMALTMDPLIAQAMVVGEGRSHIAALLVLAPEPWERLSTGRGLDPTDPDALTNPGILEQVLSLVADRLAAFPGYAQVRTVHLSLSPWTVENGLMTPTMKIKRPALEEHFSGVIDTLYE
jgi:long-chain acyl-CoA synthetase